VNRDAILLIRSNTLAELAKLSEQKARSDYSIDGQSVQHGETEERLWKRLEWCDKQLAALDAGTFIVSRIR
jgi:uncharacterized protein YbaP (TraB family)